MRRARFSTASRPRTSNRTSPRLRKQNGRCRRPADRPDRHRRRARHGQPASSGGARRCRSERPPPHPPRPSADRERRDDAARADRVRSGHRLSFRRLSNCLYPPQEPGRRRPPPRRLNSEIRRFSPRGLTKRIHRVVSATRRRRRPPSSSALIVSVPEITLSFPALEELGSGTAQAASPGISGASGGPILVVNAPDTGPILPLPAESGADGVARSRARPPWCRRRPSPCLRPASSSPHSPARRMPWPAPFPTHPSSFPPPLPHAPVVASAVPDWLLAVAPGTAAKAMPPPATAAAPADERSARTATLGPPPVRRATSPRPAPVAGPADTAGSPGRPPTAARPVRPRAVGEAVPSPQTRPNGIPPARQAGRIARPSPEPAGEPLDLARVASGMAATPRLGQSPRRLDFRADAIDLPPSLRPTGQP